MKYLANDECIQKEAKQLFKWYIVWNQKNVELYIPEAHYVLIDLCFVYKEKTTDHEGTISREQSIYEIACATEPILQRRVLVKTSLGCGITDLATNLLNMLQSG